MRGTRQQKNSGLNPFSQEPRNRDERFSSELLFDQASGSRRPTTDQCSPLIRPLLIGDERDSLCWSCWRLNDLRSMPYRLLQASCKRCSVRCLSITEKCNPISRQRQTSAHGTVGSVRVRNRSSELQSLTSISSERFSLDSPLTSTTTAAGEIAPSFLLGGCQSCPARSNILRLISV